MMKNSITKTQAVDIDKFVQEKIGLSTLVLMENAGRGVSRVAYEMLKGKGRVAIFCGRGNNGGDGFVCGRHLLTKGIDIDIYLAGKCNKIKNEAKINLDILKALGVDIQEIVDKISLEKINLEKYSLIIDGLLGIGVSGEIRGTIKEIISLINLSKIPVLSIDIPSGMDADTGEPLGCCIVANKTVTFVSKKRGMDKDMSLRYCGEVIVCDIGFPSNILTSFSFTLS
jgi:NAD(P)H-hydrate epimerase